jgi:hypothetical protein
MKSGTQGDTKSSRNALFLLSFKNYDDGDVKKYIFYESFAKI